MIKKLIVGAALALSVLIAPVAANSADLAPGYSTEIYAPVTFTGPYVGVLAGYSATKVDPVNPGTPEQKLSGASIGATAGYNYEFSNHIVVGVEGDISYGNLNRSVRDGNYIVETSKIDWSGTARARLGYNYNGIMPYVTAGVAWRNLELGESCPAGAQFGFCSRTGAFHYKQAKNQFGPTVGLGVEYKFAQNWSAKVEGLYTRYPKQTFNLGPLPAWPNKSSNDWTIRAGLNYHF